MNVRRKGEGEKATPAFVRQEGEMAVESSLGKDLRNTGLWDWKGWVCGPSPNVKRVEGSSDKGFIADMQMSV